MTKLDGWLSGLSRSALLALAASAVLAEGLVDYLTGPEISFSIFYVGPVAAAAWYAGRRPGATLSVFAAATWYVADALSRDYSSLVFGVWNSIVRLALFLVIGYTVSALKGAHEHERSLARSDPLTGVANARLFEELAGREVARAARNGEPLTVVYLDVDDFKRVNDECGHAAGDELLRCVAVEIENDIRSIDLLARLGGDEFGLLLPETDKRQARVVVEKLRGRLAGCIERHGWPVSMSFGCVTYLRAPHDVGDMVARADALMYEVKRDGKNGVRYGEEG